MPLNWIHADLRAQKIAARVRRAGRTQGKNLPIIYVPGILGVKLHDRRHRTDVWGDARALLFRNPDHAGFGVGDVPADDVVATEPLHHFPIIPYALSTLVTAELALVLERALGYREGRDLFFLGHDWRRDYRQVSERLELEIRRVQLDFGKKQRVILLGQSVSNLAIRYLLRTCSADIRDSVAKWYAFGPPWRGTFNALLMLREGYYPATRRFHGFSPADVATYSSCYQLLPQEAELLTEDGRPVGDFDIYDADCWVQYRLGPPEMERAPARLRTELAAKLRQAREFSGAVSGTHPLEQKVPQTWFAGARNHAVRSAVRHATGTLVTEAEIRKQAPKVTDRALARGDDHIPLEHLTAAPCGPLVRSYDSVPYGESYVLIGEPKHHRAIINFTPNLEALAMDIAEIRSQA